MKAPPAERGRVEADFDQVVLVHARFDTAIPNGDAAYLIEAAVSLDNQQVTFP